MDDAIIRLLSIELHNLKNVVSGIIKMQKNEFSDNAEVLGIYGQNGSGKTSVIQTLSLFKQIATGGAFWTDIDDCINVDSNSCSFTIKLAVQLGEKDKYIAAYSWSIARDAYHGKPGFLSETLSASKLNEDGTKSKMTPYFVCNYTDSTQVFEPECRFKSVTGGIHENEINVVVAYRIARENRTSFLFSQPFIDILAQSEESELKKLVLSIRRYAYENLFVFLNSHNGGISLDAFLPLAVIHSENGVKTFGEFPINLQEPMVTSKEQYNFISNIVANLSLVMNAIVPGLFFETRNYGAEMQPDGSEGVRFEIVSTRYKKTFALRYESEGIKKLFSVIGVLIAAYNNPGVCVAIDELDSGIFESLLGMIVCIIKETGRGQLIFTSHNLRPLEVLDKDSIIFSTVNPEHRYMKMTYIKKTNNLRDCYIRALNLGGQEEELAAEVKEADIRRAFRQAGRNEKN